MTRNPGNSTSTHSFRALYIVLGLAACGSPRSVPTFVTSNDPWRCTVAIDGPASQAFEADSVKFDRQKQCPASIRSDVFGGDTVPIKLNARSKRTDMLSQGSDWKVWDNTGDLRGGGQIILIDDTHGDVMRVIGEYRGGMGNAVHFNPVVYKDTGRVTVSFAGLSTAVTLRTEHFVQKVNPGDRPQLLGPSVASTGFAAHFYMYTTGSIEPYGFRYTWFVDGQEVQGYSYQHILNHVFNVDGWHTVQVRMFWGSFHEEWQTLSVYSMNCGGPNQCLRAPPGPPPDDLPDARHQQTSPRMPAMRNGGQ